MCQCVCDWMAKTWKNPDSESNFQQTGNFSLIKISFIQLDTYMDTKLECKVL